MAVMALTEEIQPQVGLWLDQLDLWSLNSGTSVPQVNNKDLYPLAFCVPPVAEQRRIVAKVDELMGICDDLEARLQRTREACLSFAASAVASVA
jgi:type I restriction enzyme S subunit